MTITRKYQVLVKNKVGPALREVLIVDSTSCDELLDGKYILHMQEVIPEDHKVGDIVYIEWFCNHELVPWCTARVPLVIDCTHNKQLLRVTSIQGWDRDLCTPDNTPAALDTISWEYNPIPGNRKYLVVAHVPCTTVLNVPEGFEVRHNNVPSCWEVAASWPEPQRSKNLGGRNIPIQVLEVLPT